MNHQAGRRPRETATDHQTGKRPGRRRCTVSPAGSAGTASEHRAGRRPGRQRRTIRQAGGYCDGPAARQEAAGNCDGPSIPAGGPGTAMDPQVVRWPGKRRWTIGPAGARGRSRRCRAAPEAAVRGGSPLRGFRVEPFKPQSGRDGHWQGLATAPRGRALATWPCRGPRSAGRHEKAMAHQTGRRRGKW